MIRMEYPKANIEGLSTEEKIIAVKRQLDMLTNNVQLVLESIDGDIEGINEYIGGVPDELDNSVSSISERVDEVETAVGTLEERDYIVEQGTDGIWTYRKWSSGLCEVYGKYSDTSSTAYTSAGVGYYRLLTVNLPNVLTAIDNPQLSARTGNVGGVTLRDVSATALGILIFSTTTTGRPIDLYISIKGRWK